MTLCTNVTLVSQHRSLWGGKTTLQHLVIDNATVWYRDERRGNGKSLDLKIPQTTTVTKMQQEAQRLSSLRMRIFVKTVSPFEAFSSWGIICTIQSLVKMSQRSHLGVCYEIKHTTQWHRKVGEPGFWFPCWGKRNKETGDFSNCKKWGKWKKWDKWMCVIIYLRGKRGKNNNTRAWLKVPRVILYNLGAFQPKHLGYLWVEGWSKGCLYLYIYVYI